MLLPYVNTSDQNLSILQTRWKPILDTLIKSPTASPTILSNIIVAAGLNVINHMLQQPLQGYIVILKSADVDIWDNQSTNQTPQLTLNLQSSGAATISLLVF